MAAVGEVGETDRQFSLLGDADRLLGDADRLLIDEAIDENHASAMGLLGFDSSVSNHSSASHSALRAGVVFDALVLGSTYPFGLSNGHVSGDVYIP